MAVALGNPEGPGESARGQEGMWSEALAKIKAWKQNTAPVFWVTSGSIWAGVCRRVQQGQGSLGVLMSSGCWVR